MNHFFNFSVLLISNSFMSMHETTLQALSVSTLNLYSILAIYTSKQTQSAAYVICFEYNGLKYKIRSNAGDADCNDGNFGAVYDVNNDKIMYLISSGDTQIAVNERRWYKSQ